jgi:hypothetical protein
MSKRSSSVVFSVLGQTLDEWRRGRAFFQFYILAGTPGEAENKRPADGGEDQSSSSPFLGNLGTEDGVFGRSYFI